MNAEVSLLELLPFGCIFHNIDMKGELHLTFVNTASQTLTGLHLSGTDKSAFQAYINQLQVSNNHNVDLDKIIKNPRLRKMRCLSNDTSKWLRFDFKLINENSGLLTTITDITEEERRIGQLAKDKSNAEATSKAKSEFLSNMSHEIRTPLNGVIGFSELLIDTKLKGVQRKYLDNIHVSAKSLMDLINNILDFSKIEAGKLELFPEKTDLLQTVETVVEIVRFNAHKKNLELILNIFPDIPLKVIVDELRLRQVLINIITNAIKFTDNGEVELQLKLMKIDEKKRTGKFRFVVRDTGIGVSEKDKRKLFKAFSQVETSTSRRYEGSGLGLVISNTLLQKMNSKIQLDSKLGAGSKFFFDLDLKLFDANPLPKMKFSGIKKVMVVDDHPVTRSVLVDMLNYQTLKVSQAEDGLDAIRMVGEEPSCDLIIMDYHMPYINGLDVIRKIRDMENEKSNHQVFILLCSSSDDLSNIEELEKLNVFEKLLKPIKPDEFYDVLSKIDSYLTEKISANKATIKVVKKNHQSVDPITVLIAEDDDVNMMLTAEVILQLFPKARLLKAYNGNRAVELFKEKRPDLVLMDINMPGLNGLEATLAIRQFEHGKGARVPVFALTAKVLEETFDECCGAGMDRYITKPIRIEELSKILVEHLPHMNFIHLDKHKHNSIDDNLHFNRDFLMEKIAGRVATFDRLIETARISIPGYLLRIKSSLDNHNFIEAADVAHSLKGAAATLCFSKMEKMALQLEKNKDEPEEMKRLFSDLKGEWKILQKLI